MRLTRRNVLRLRLAREPSSLLSEGAKLVAGVVAIMAAAAGLLLVSSVYTIPEVVLLVTAAFVACAFAFAVNRWPRRLRWRYPVLALDDHPRLAALVADAARLAGYESAPRVRLSAFAFVRADRSWRGTPDLVLGLPLLMALSEPDLHALMVRELLTVKLWRRHEHSAVLLFLHHGTEGDELRQACRPLRQALWAEAHSLVGRERLAAASRAEVFVKSAFNWHLTRYVAPFAYRGAALDMYESFLWKIQWDGLLNRIVQHVQADVTIHPEEEELFGEGPWSTPDPAGMVAAPSGVVQRVDGGLELRLAKVINHRLLEHGGFSLFNKPYRLDEIPAADWSLATEQEREAVIEAAGKLLGRPVAALDVVELAVAGRAGELSWWHTEQLCPHASPGVCALLPLFDVALRRKGYVHEHPFVQRELVGPLGNRVNLVELAAKAARGEPYGILLGGWMEGRDPEADAIRLAAESLAEGDPVGWFERLYAESAAGDAIVPWDSHSPHYLLVEWATAHGSGQGRALVVGAGLGDDAECVAGLGYETVAFDVSESAIRLAKERFPESRVRYQTADLLDPPTEWRHAFDLVVEIMTVQALPEPLHAQAVAAVGEFVRPGGTLLVIASGREEGGPVFAPPWPLTPSEIAAFAGGGLEAGTIEDLRDGERHRWRATFHRPA
ncbi:methyltransferase domain-containing protein [Nonomuraea sp. H19]|uniref:methyltransferase domain-containing protein n=1 Tax=Nonomuraea sp. H19 TaxID=3452206 RepID=UPI003F89B270